MWKTSGGGSQITRAAEDSKTWLRASLEPLPEPHPGEQQQGLFHIICVLHCPLPWIQLVITAAIAITATYYNGEHPEGPSRNLIGSSSLSGTTQVKVIDWILSVLPAIVYISIKMLRRHDQAHPLQMPHLLLWHPSAVQFRHAHCHHLAENSETAES